VVNNSGILAIAANNSPGAISGTGTLYVSASATTPAVNQGSVIIQSGGTLKIQGPSAAVGQTSSLSIASTGKLDLTNNSFTVNYTAGKTPAATIRYLSTAFDGGKWDGYGITSSLADAMHWVGYADSADGVVAGLAANSIEMKLARPGDANLDGKVDFADLVILAQNYGKTGMNWDQGDFNYDGTVNFADLVILAQNYGQSFVPAAAPAVSAVPEPSGWVAGLAAAMLGLCRQRKSGHVREPHPSS